MDIGAANDKKRKRESVTLDTKEVLRRIEADEKIVYIYYAAGLTKSALKLLVKENKKLKHTRGLLQLQMFRQRSGVIEKWKNY